MPNPKYDTIDALEILGDVGEERFPEFSIDERRAAAVELLHAVATLDRTAGVTAQVQNREGRALAVVTVAGADDLPITVVYDGRKGGPFLVSLPPEYQREPVRPALTYSRRLHAWQGREYDPPRYDPESTLKLRRGALAEIALAVATLLRPKT